MGGKISSANSNNKYKPNGHKLNHQAHHSASPFAGDTSGNNHNHHTEDDLLKSKIDKINKVLVKKHSTSSLLGDNKEKPSAKTIDNKTTANKDIQEHDKEEHDGGDDKEEHDTIDHPEDNETNNKSITVPSSNNNNTSNKQSSKKKLISEKKPLPESSPGIDKQISSSKKSQPLSQVASQRSSSSSQSSKKSQPLSQPNAKILESEKKVSVLSKKANRRANYDDDDVEYEEEVAYYDDGEDIEIYRSTDDTGKHSYLTPHRSSSSIDSNRHKTIAPGHWYIIEGKWDDNDRVTGKGRYIYPNGGVYEGYFVEDMAHGKGKYSCNGVVYEGDFVEDTCHGQGVCTYSDGAKYVGEWKNNKRHGQGRYDAADRSFYNGLWANDKRDGKGFYNFANGDMYDGAWKEDKFHGYGRYTFSNHQIYEGGFCDGNYDGDGYFKYNNGKIVDVTHRNGYFVG